MLANSDNRKYSYCLVQAIKVHKYLNLIGGNLNEQS